MSQSKGGEQKKKMEILKTSTSRNGGAADKGCALRSHSTIRQEGEAEVRTLAGVTISYGRRTRLCPQPPTGTDDASGVLLPVWEARTEPLTTKLKYLEKNNV